MAFVGRLSFALILLGSCMLIESLRMTLPPMPKPGFIQPWIPSLDDWRLCRENADGRKLRLVTRIPLETCKPMCIYENETQQINAVNGQLCCDIGGLLPTGMCKDGTCLVGGMVGMDENGVKTIFSEDE